MSIAWTTIALVVLLFPGILFFFGLYSGQRLSRETIQPGVLSELAFVVLVSFVVHALTFSVLQSICGARIPCIRLDIVFALLQLNGSEKISLKILSGNLSEYNGWIFGYLATSAGLGLIIGLLIDTRRAKKLIGRNLRRFVAHRWIYELLDSGKETIIVAHVLTHIRGSENKVLIYRGFLYAYYFAKDGRVAYLVLANTSRYYLCLNKDSIDTSAPEEWRTIGSTHGKVDGLGDSKLSLLVIEGEDIANVVFDRFEPHIKDRQKEALQRLEDAIKDLRQQQERHLDDANARLNLAMKKAMQQTGEAKDAKPGATPPETASSG